MKLIAFFLVFFLAAFPGSTVSAQGLTKAGQAGMTFLRIEVGARPAGQGGTFITRTGDALGAFWNPAGLGHIRRTGGSFSHVQWLADVKQNAFSGVLPVGNGTFALTGLFMDYGTLYGTRVASSQSGDGGFEYEDTGTFSIAEYAVGLAYGHRITDRFSVGAHLRYAHSALGDNTILVNGALKDVANTTNAVVLDLGTSYQTGWRDLAFAMSIRNLSGQLVYPEMEERFYLPLVYTLGLSFDAFQMAGLDVEGQRLTLEANSLHPNDSVERLHLGAEYAWQNQFFLRGGYKFRNDLESISAGLGVVVGVGASQLRVDYAATQMKYFDTVHRLSVGVSF